MRGDVDLYRIEKTLYARLFPLQQYSCRHITCNDSLPYLKASDDNCPLRLIRALRNHSFDTLTMLYATTNKPLQERVEIGALRH